MRDLHEIRQKRPAACFVPERLGGARALNGLREALAADGRHRAAEPSVGVASEHVDRGRDDAAMLQPAIFDLFGGRDSLLGIAIVAGLALDCKPGASLD